MKSKNSLPPALLASGQENKTWIINIDLGKGQWVKMEFTDKTQAVTEYERCRQGGIYVGRWIQEITINEQISGS